MKRVILYFLLCITLASCSPTLEVPVIAIWDSVPLYNNQAIIDSLEKYKPYYLTYKAGDSIAFLREDNTIDTYCVTQAGMSIYYDTTINSDTIKTAGIAFCLEQEKQHIDIYMYIGRYETMYQSLFIYNKLNTWKGTLPDFTLTDTDIIISGEGSWCVLRRNVGIVYVQDYKRHTWTTIFPI